MVVACSGARVSVGTSATLLSTSETDANAAGAPRGDGSGIQVLNLSTTATVDLGGSGVTTGAGFPLGPGVSTSVDLKGEALYAVAASGTVSVAVLQVGI